MKKENNLYDEPTTKGKEEKEPEVSFVLGGQDPGPDMQEMDSGLSIKDSLIYFVGSVDEFSLLDFMAKTRTVLKNRPEENSSR